MAKQPRTQHHVKPGQRAKKSRCTICHRVIPHGKSCPLAPHIFLTNGHVIRPIKH